MVAGAAAQWPPACSQHHGQRPPARCKLRPAGGHCQRGFLPSPHRPGLKAEARSHAAARSANLEARTMLVDPGPLRTKSICGRKPWNAVRTARSRRSFGYWRRHLDGLAKQQPVGRGALRAPSWHRSCSALRTRTLEYSPRRTSKPSPSLASASRGRLPGPRRLQQLHSPARAFVPAHLFPILSHRYRRGP